MVIQKTARSTEREVFLTKMVIWYTKENGKRINGAAKENYTLQKVIKSNMITKEVSKMTKDTAS